TQFCIFNNGIPYFPYSHHFNNFLLVANVYEVNASTIKLKATFFAMALDGQAEILDRDLNNILWQKSNLKFISAQSECLIFSTSVPFFIYCISLEISNMLRLWENIDNSQGTCYQVDGNQTNRQLSFIDCGQIPSNITLCDL
ncbi:1358_t:CDS:2, partial [Cetraspora pellucida]